MPRMHRRRLLLSALATSGLLAGPPLAVAQGGRRLIVGAGATFPAPIILRWAEEFEALQGDFTVAYDVVGSGEGVSRFMTGSVNFAASDSAMSDEQIGQVANGVRMIPATAGMVGVVYNLAGLTAPLRVPRELLPLLFNGGIEKWDDPRLAAANPGQPLPSRTVAKVVRLDSSGTTFAFTNHLAAISDDWRERYGAATLIAWPKGTMVARGNEGVAGRVLITEDSIGYVEYGFASRLGLPMAELENAAGEFVAPSIEAGVAALEGSADAMPANLRLFIADPQGPGAYPVTTFSWLLLYGSYADEQLRTGVTEFARYALTDGQKVAPELGYVPLPPVIGQRALTALDGAG